MLDPRVDGDERGRQTGDHEDREDELRQDECGVVDVELAAGPVRACEHPVSHKPHDVAREGQRREQDGATRDERRQAVTNEA